MITFHLLLARKHGSAIAEPILVSYEDAQALTHAYEDVTGPGCAEFAKTYAELLFIRDMNEVAHHDFPDPSVIEAARVKSVLADALAIRAAADSASAEIDAAKERAAAAKAVLKTLTPEQIALLKASDDEEAKAGAAAKADAKAASDAAAQAEADGRAAQEAAGKELAEAAKAAGASTEATAAVTVGAPAAEASPQP